jgi:hypothetical protein
MARSGNVSATAAVVENPMRSSRSTIVAVGLLWIGLEGVALRNETAMHLSYAVGHRSIMEVGAGGRCR